MADPADNAVTLEARTMAAHRAYIDALTAWERLVEVSDAETGVEYARACADAEVRKEERRIVFRDLVDDLGYVPTIQEKSPSK
jgi:hypothetical protein